MEINIDKWIAAWIINLLVFTVAERWLSVGQSSKPYLSHREKISKAFYQAMHFPLISLWLPLTGFYWLEQQIFKLPHLNLYASLETMARGHEIALSVAGGLLFLFCWDLLEYLVHRALHRLDWLWKFHSVHHAQHHLNWWSNLHFHSAEILIYKSFTALCLWFIWGYSLPENLLFIIGIFRFTVGNYAHSTLPSLPRFFGYWVNTPAVHLWHHAKEKPGFNLGVTFTLWDRIGKTFYFPPTPPQSLGYPGDEKNQSLVENYLIPFKK